MPQSQHTLCSAIVMALACCHALAAERAKLSIPPAISTPTSAKSSTSTKARAKLLRPARIAVADDEPTPLPAEPAINPKARKPAKRQATTVAEVEVADSAQQATPPVQSSRRTATGGSNSPSRIAFRLVEVVPLTPQGVPEDTTTSRKANKSSLLDAYHAAKERAVEVYEPVIVSAEPITAEYEEEVVTATSPKKNVQPRAQAGAEEQQEPAPIVSTAAAGSEEENLAPIVSAADLPRPMPKRRTLFDELRTPSDLSLPPFFQR